MIFSLVSDFSKSIPLLIFSISLLKECVCKKFEKISLFLLKSNFNSAKSKFIGTSFFNVTSFFEIKAKSLNSIRFSLLLFCLISLLLVKRSSKLLNSFIKSAAVFNPIPGTPGILSLLSPANA